MDPVVPLRWGAKPTKCLSADNHDREVTETLTHYFGCIEFDKREDYFVSLDPQSQNQIKTDLRRIAHLREVLGDSGSGDHLYVEAVNKSAAEWRRAQAKQIEDVRKKTKRGEPKYFDPNESDDREPMNPNEYHPDKDFKAYAITFTNGIGSNVESPLCNGSFPNQKIPVDDLIRHPQSPLRKSHATPAKPRVRYFHLPSNNMKWVQDAIATYYEEPDTQYDTHHLEAERRTKANTLLHRNFWRRQEQGRDSHILHARHMRPFCEPVSSDHTKEDNPRNNMVMFMPYMHWDTDRQRKNFATIFEQKFQSHQDELRAEENKKFHDRRTSRSHLYDNGRPPPLANPDSFSTRGPLRSGTHDSYASKRHVGSLADAARIMVMLRRYKNRKYALPGKSPLGQFLSDAAKLCEVMDSFRDRKLMEEYLLHNPHIHPRRTLDQSYYWALRNTKARDRDQVVYKKTSARLDMLHRYDPNGKKGEEWDCAKRHRPSQPNVPEVSGTEALQGNGHPTTSHGTFLGKYLSPNSSQSHQNGHNSVHHTSSHSDLEFGLPDYPRTRDYATDHENHRHDKERNESCSECREAIQKVPRLIMVDQLWMWILDHETIVTCFPRRYGVNRKDASGVHRSIRNRLGSMKRCKIRSAYDLALIIIEECSSIFFDPTKTDDRQPQVMDLFSEAISDIAQKQNVYVAHLWQWADELALVAARKSSVVDLSNIHKGLLNITKEGHLQRETKNIIEELGIMIFLLKKQKKVIQQFKRHSENLMDTDGHFKSGYVKTRQTLNGKNGDEAVADKLSGSAQQMEEEYKYDAWKEFRANAEESIIEMERRLEELENLHRSAEEVAKDIDQLLGMKQQQANVVQAWQAIRQGEEAVKQGRAIMIFTVITIIFLPLAFMAAIFGMNNDLLGDERMSFWKQIKLIFCISLGIVAVVIVIAFSSFFRCLWWCFVHYVVNWIIVHSGIYRLWLGMPDELRTDTMVKWAEKNVQDMKAKERSKFRRKRAEFYVEERRRALEEAEKQLKEEEASLRSST